MWNLIPAAMEAKLANRNSQWGYWSASSLSQNSHLGYTYLWQVNRAALVRDPVEHVWSWRVENSEKAYSNSFNLITAKFVSKRCGAWIPLWDG